MYKMSNFLMTVFSCEEGLTRNKMEIEDFFSKHQSSTERKAFIKESYQSGYKEFFSDIPLIANRFGHIKLENGMLIWAGQFLQRKNETFYSWEAVAKIVSTLIENGEYAVPEKRRAVA